MRILHAGCGGMTLPAFFSAYEEVRLDANPAEKTDICASIEDMGDIGTFDVVYSSHVLEHLYPHQVPKALKEFFRVTTGYAMIIVPDLEDLVINDEVLFEAQVGPITPMDMLYGHREQMNNPHMAHHTGFTAKTLKKALHEAGFKNVTTTRDSWNLTAIASPHGA